MNDPGRWTALLDALDEGLAASPPVLLDAVPDDAGLLPLELAARAARTLQRMAEVEVALERGRADLARELSALANLKANAVGRGTASVPHFLDTKA